MAGYQRAEVEHVLPYLFDPEAAYGIKSEIYVEDGMPKGYSDPGHGNTIYASLADVRRGWRLTELTERERQSILLRYALDEDQEVIASYLGVRRQTVAYYLERGVGKLTAWLNGETYVDGYDSLPELAAA
ncbi:sigma factor-like helix-turn-helix DNA-binding protein [Streptomyces sp. NPDC057499]|uniref:sigma-70 region 4 domain-containing protein n=1 Tax=Streptomyces sp. NPDC057499 TaxID=3346150 RepID=UPI003679D1C7